jgi:alcohol dehydrogenase
MIGAALGARVVAVDVSAAARRRARELGAAVTVDATEQDPVEAVLAATSTGAHLSVDALGSPATAGTSVRCLRRRGRHVQVGLLLGADATPPIPMDEVVAKELSVHGTHGMAARDYPPLLEMVASGLLRPDLLIGEVIGLDQAPAALTAMGRPRPGAGMTVIAMRGRPGQNPTG